MAKRFSGQVKASDIQTEFDTLVSKVNELIDIYNASIDTSDIDFTRGSSSLGAYNYCLTVGGLKKILQACNGTVVGCKAYKNGSDLIVSDGLIITSTGVYRTPYTVQQNFNNIFLYYNPTNGTFTRSDSSTAPTGSYRIAEVEMRRENVPVVNDFRNAQIEDTAFRIKVGNKYKDQFDSNGFYNNTSMFLSGSEYVGEQKDSGSWSRNWYRALLFGSEVSWNVQSGSQKRQYYQIVNALYIPKGVSNPYVYQRFDGENPGTYYNTSENTQMTMSADKKFS